jgi:peroxiredoxin Q/BCP
MRDDYARFRALGTEIVVVTRHDAAAMRAHWHKERLPYLGIADEQGRITARFGQQWKLHKLGRMPAQLIIDCAGTVAFAHYGASMSDIPDNARMLALIGMLPGCARPPAAPPARAP